MGSHVHTRRIFTPASHCFTPKLRCMHILVSPKLLMCTPRMHIFFFFFRYVTPPGRPLGPPEGYRCPKGIYTHARRACVTLGEPMPLRGIGMHAPKGHAYRYVSFLFDRTVDLRSPGFLAIKCTRRVHMTTFGGHLRYV